MADLPQMLVFQMQMLNGHKVWKIGPAKEVLYLSLPYRGKVRAEIPPMVPELLAQPDPRELAARARRFRRALTEKELRQVPRLLLPVSDPNTGRLVMRRQLPDDFDARALLWPPTPAPVRSSRSTAPAEES